MALYDLYYQGQMLSWIGHGVFPATSGLPGYQNASQQGVMDHGPVPEGLYSFPLILAKTATMTAPGQLDVLQGVQYVPELLKYHGQTYSNVAWGPERVRLTIHHIDNPKNRHRSGFYLHDSTKGYSHGCIEVSPHFFKMLRDYITSGAAKRAHRKHLYLRVQYVLPDISTYGGTKAP